MYPNQGKEYDDLIKVEKLDSNNQYRLSIPRVVGDSSGWPNITLVYSSHAKEKGCREETLPDGTQLICLPKDESREELVLNGAWAKTTSWLLNEKMYEGDFKIINKENYSVEVSVIWETSACLTFGRKVIVE
jgi:hypothetical protein